MTTEELQVLVASKLEKAVLLSTYWAKTGIRILQNLCNGFAELSQKGLISPRSAVQVCFEPFLQTSQYAGSLCFYPDFRLCLTGIKPKNIQGYLCLFGAKTGIKSISIPALLAMKRASKNVPSIRNSNGSLQIRFNPGDGSGRKCLSLGLPDSKQNRIYAELAVKRIQNDILAGNFDGNLDKYKPQKATQTKPLPSQEVLIKDLWDKYVTYKRPQVSPSTLVFDYERVSKWIDRFPTTIFNEAIEVRDWLLVNTTPGQAQRVLKQLSGCGRWAVKSKIIDVNPYDGLAADINIKSDNDDDDTDIFVFSEDERDRIIQEFRDRDSHYAAMVEFIFRTGCRPSEAIGLTWANISLDCKKITFKQAVVTGEDRRLMVKQGLKTQEKRVFPCGEGMREFLQSIAPRKRTPEQFLFTSPQGKLVDFQNFARREWKPVLKDLAIERRNPYQMRHTYITFCLESGIDAKDVAKWVGNSPEIIYRRYAGAKKGLDALDI